MLACLHVDVDELKGDVFLVEDRQDTDGACRVDASVEFESHCADEMSSC